MYMYNIHEYVYCTVYKWYTVPYECVHYWYYPALIDTKSLHQLWYFIDSVLNFAYPNIAICFPAFYVCITVKKFLNLTDDDYLSILPGSKNQCTLTSMNNHTV